MEDKKLESKNDEKLQEKNKSKRISIIIIIGIILLVIVGVEIYFLQIIQNGKWETEDAHIIRLEEGGDISFFDAGVGNDIGNFEFLDRYVYLGHRNIIAYGEGGIQRLSFTHVSKNKLVLKYANSKYVFYEAAYVLAKQPKPIRFEGDDKIDTFTCKECAALMHEEKTKYYVSTSIDNKSIGALEAKELVYREDNVTTDKGNRIRLAKNVKYYFVDIESATMEKEVVDHECEYKQLSFNNVVKMYDGEPKYAYIWLNENNEAEIVLYVKSEVYRFAKGDIRLAAVHKNQQRIKEKNKIDYKSIREIANDN